MVDVEMNIILMIYEILYKCLIIESFVGYTKRFNPQGFDQEEIGYIGLE